MWRIIKVIQACMDVLVPARLREIHSKMKVLEWSQNISHCKSMQTFYDAQRQSEVESTRHSNSSKGFMVVLVT